VLLEVHYELLAPRLDNSVLTLTPLQTSSYCYHLLLIFVNTTKCDQ